MKKKNLIWINRLTKPPWTSSTKLFTSFKVIVFGNYSLAKQALNIIGDSAAQADTFYKHQHLFFGENASLFAHMAQPNLIGHDFPITLVHLVTIDES